MAGIVTLPSAVNESAKAGSWPWSGWCMARWVHSWSMFPARIRSTALSLPYHLGVGILGGFLPFVAAALVAARSSAGQPPRGTIDDRLE